MPAIYTRNDTWRVSLVIAGHDFGVWDGKDGGEVDSDSTTYRPGNMGPARALAGAVTTGNVTLRRQYGSDMHEVAPNARKSELQLLLTLAGKGKGTVKQRPLGDDGQAFGPTITYACVLKRVLPPTHDSMSSDANMIEIELTVDGIPDAS